MADASRWVSRRILPHPGGSKEPVIGWYGGHPRGIRSSVWPRCAVCGAPMCHMMQVEAGAHLDLGVYQRMSVFICHATGGRCEDWDPWKGANKVLLHDAKDDSLYDGPPTVRVYRRLALAAGEANDEVAVMRRVKAGELAMNDALASLRHDKLGGGAVWLQGDDTPKSRRGEGPMRLLAQVTTDIVGFDITPGGMAYVFVDPNDPSPNAAVLLWQSGGS
jgi:hypothetical protein